MNKYEKLTQGWSMEMIEARMSKVDGLIDSYTEEYHELNKIKENMENADILMSDVFAYDDNQVEIELTLDETEEAWGLTEGSAPFDDNLDDTSTLYLCTLGMPEER